MMHSHHATKLKWIPLLFLVLTSSLFGQTTKPAMVSAGEWGSKPQPLPEDQKQTPQWITLHHAGELWTGKRSPDEYVRAMQAWGQKEKNWPDLPYHFLIAPDGRIFEGRPIEYAPASNTRYGLMGNIGVEMMGNFEVQRPSAQQLQSTVNLVAWLAQEYKIDLDHIRGHKDAAPGQTDCPGKDFYRYLEDGTFRKWVEATMRGESPQVQPAQALQGGPTETIPTTAPTTRP
jgi:hypothetical protein